ncbi:hypothetical protein C5167_028257 [Papaver somniferum]|uniref:homeobox-leucine zipper protein ATHB-6-like n=1 Tax=Papaver somniferum TaxID=3469 RepID=UPI000E6F52B4|nr:homeobox-leucine zipper protein ATHB-6-like [Papaver somniferum]RZC87804.1 hypothetical protein C5167_028257 [Papaver somniferum]
MKRLGSSDSLGGLISISPSTDEKNCNNSNSAVYSKGFQSMMVGLEEEDCLEETGGYNITEKKRRLSADQVRALEKNFEVENKLEPETKVKLAHELNLQPRQVAVWFQNRRARWKTKQLERDYGFLKANYDDLRLKFLELQQSKELLLLELHVLKSKMKEENTESNGSVKDEMLISEEENCKVYVNHDEERTNYENNGRSILMFGDVKDGSSDSSDTSAILNEEINNNNNYYSPAMPISSSPTSAVCFQFSASKTSDHSVQNQSHLQQTSVKMEDFGAEEPCDFFSDEQAPSLQWYCHEPWN